MEDKLKVEDVYVKNYLGLGKVTIFLMKNGDEVGQFVEVFVIRLLWSIQDHWKVTELSLV